MESPVALDARVARLEQELHRCRRAEEDLRQSEARLRLLLEHGYDVVYRFRCEPRGFDYISPGVAQLCGYTALEFCNAPGLVFDLVHRDDRPLLQTYLEAGDFGRPLAVRLRRRDAEVIWIENRALPAYDADGRLTVLEGVVREVTSYGRALEGLDRDAVSAEERERLVSALRRIGSATLASLELDHVVDTLAEQVVRAGIFRSLMVALVDHEAHTVRVARNYLSFEGNYEDGIGAVRPGARIVPSPTVAYRDGERLVFSDQRIIGTTYDLDDANITPTVARTGELTVIDGPDDRFDPRFEHSDPKHREGVTSYFIPIRRQGRVLAVLATGSDRAQKEEMLRRVESMEPLFEQAAIALDHAWTHGRVRDHARQLRELNHRLQDEVSRRVRAEETLRDFSTRTVNLAEEERRRVARELHDGVNQLLCAVGFGLEAAAGDARGPVVERLETTRQVLDRSIQEVRRISQDLRPGVLDDLGLVPALRSLCDDLSRRTGIDIAHDLEEVPHDLRPEIAVTLFRLVQEALQQVPVDGGISGLRVRLGVVDGQLCARLALAEAGATRQVWQPCAGHLNERAGLLGGRVILEETGASPHLVILLPLPVEDGGTA